jgi:diketogulonate reductase-like aldo/keto reductase
MSDVSSCRRGLSRRDLLGLLASGSLWLAARPVLGAGGAGGAGSGAALRGQLKRPIPKSKAGEMLPAVGLGTARVFDVGTGAAEREPLKEALRLFVGEGGQLVDTSPMYGAAETVVGELAAALGVRPKLFLATKVWTTGREEGIRQMETSMKRLGAERLDLIQVHNLVDLGTQLATLREWKAKGRVRYIGITHYQDSAHAELERVMRAEDIDFVQLNYSIVSRAAEARLLPLAMERKIGVLVNRPFERADLFDKVKGKALPPWAAEFDCTSWAQFFLKFVLSHPAVTCAIPASSKPKHLMDNMQAGRGRLADRAMRERMAELVREL